MSKSLGQKTEEAGYEKLPGFERKHFPTFVKSYDEDQGIVEHFVAVIGNVDEGGDRVMPNAFVKTISERSNRIKALDMHSTDSVTRIVGRPLEMREVGKNELTPEILAYAPDATGGLLIKTQYAIDTTRGRDVFNLVKGGYAPESSIGYDAVQKEYVKELDRTGKERIVRNLNQIRLWEYSNVIFGMNPATAVVSAKAKDEPTEAKPYGVIPEGDEYCVYKLDAEGKPTGKPLGKHPTEAEARAQMRALYANEDKATWSASFINDLPDSSFLLVESGGDKDADGKTTPRSLRHLPYKNAEGDIDLPHLRAAISRLSQEGTGESGGEKWLTEDVRKRLLSRARGLLKQQDKAINLSQQVEDVRQAFMTQYNSPNGRWYYWVNTVYDEYLIVCHESENGIEYYQIAYSQTDDNYTFAPMGEWIEGQYEFTPGGDKSFKAGRVLSDRNAKRIKAAMDALHTCLMEAGLMEMPEDNDKTGPQKSDVAPTSESASEAGPNEDTRTRYLKLIEIEQQKLELLEV